MNSNFNNFIRNCGEMSTNDGDKSLKSGPVCTKSQEIIYAWAMDAPELILPKDVAFKVGGNTDAKYIVLQVHYASIEKFLGIYEIFKANNL
jgi:peptidylglycine monooxygenase